MLRDKLRGTGVALVTPFTADDKVDFNALEKVIDHVIRGGVEYVVTLGTTGEVSTLTREEKIDVIQFTFEKVNSAVPVVVGIGGNNTKELIHDIETFPLEKAMAILSASPYYSKPSQEGLYQHYKALAESTNKPILLYNVPARTGRNLNAETTLRLANDIDNIAGIKEAAGDMGQSIAILRDKPADFLVVSGDDALSLPLIACGMEGVISVAANALPKEFSEMVRHCLKGDFKVAKGMNDTMIDAYNIMFAENNPAGVKAALAIMGLIENNLRLPLVPLSEEWFRNMQKYLSSLN